MGFPLRMNAYMDEPGTLVPRCTMKCICKSVKLQLRLMSTKKEFFV